MYYLHHMSYVLWLSCLTVPETYRQHSDKRSVLIDQQGLERRTTGDKEIDQHGAGRHENLTQSEDAELKAWLQIHTQVFQDADQICTAATIFLGQIADFHEK